VKIGDNTVKLNPNFKIYFNTREANPNLNPVVFSKTTVIDCTMTAQVRLNVYFPPGLLANGRVAGVGRLANQGRN